MCRPGAAGQATAGQATRLRDRHRYSILHLHEAALQAREALHTQEAAPATLHRELQDRLHQALTAPDHLHQVHPPHQVLLLHQAVAEGRR
ncbi:MAG: hypothetical protein MZV64_18650 [Ignavibacteriales bacterium]|nr:hypothetical protein [Ignavibacteriales bacterium]